MKMIVAIRIFVAVKKGIKNY